MGSREPILASRLLASFSIQVDRLDRHLQFVLPLHVFFEFLIDEFHPVLFLRERFLKTIVCSVLVLLHFQDRFLKGNALLLRLFGKQHLAARLIDREDGVATGTANVNRGFFPVHVDSILWLLQLLLFLLRLQKRLAHLFNGLALLPFRIFLKIAIKLVHQAVIVAQLEVHVRQHQSHLCHLGSELKCFFQRHFCLIKPGEFVKREAEVEKRGSGARIGLHGFLAGRYCEIRFVLIKIETRKVVKRMIDFFKPVDIDVNNIGTGTDVSESKVTAPVGIGGRNGRGPLDQCDDGCIGTKFTVVKYQSSSDGNLSSGGNAKPRRNRQNQNKQKERNRLVRESHTLSPDSKSLPAVGHYGSGNGR